MIEFTKQQFRELLDLNKIDLRANNICYYQDKKYEIKTLDIDNIVKLIEL